MSDTYDAYPPQTPTDTGGSGTADVAKEQASQLKDSASGAASQVAGTAKSEARNIASEAKSQAKGLLGQTRDQLSDQAGTQQKRAASGIRSIGDELKTMADNSEGGAATNLVHQAASRAGGVADWLDDRDPRGLVDDVSRFARERPGTFIAIAAVAGLVAGRLTRSIVSEAREQHGATGSGTARATTSSAGFVDAPGADYATSGGSFAGGAGAATVAGGATAGYDSADQVGGTGYDAPVVAGGADYDAPVATSEAGYDVPGQSTEYDTVGDGTAAGYQTTDDFDAAGDYVGSGSTGENEAPLSTPEIDGPPLSVGNEPYRSDDQYREDQR